MPQLARVLKLRDLTLLVIGSVIGSGIFLVPGGVLRGLDYSVGLALGVWCAGGLLSLLGALTYGELAAANPEVGGLYVYLRDGLGRLPAFLYGWALFWVINTGSVATLAVAFADTLSQVVPMDRTSKVLVAVLVIGAVAIVNVRGTRHSADLQNWTTLVKAGALLVMSVALLILGRNLGSPGPEPAATASTLSVFSALGVAMIGVLWAYEGWQIVTFSAGETVDAQRTFPRAFFVGTVALIGIYLLANVAYLAALGPAGLGATKNAAAAALGATVGPWAERAITAAILVSMFSAANSNLLTGPRVYYAMAHDGLFFKRLTEVHPRFGTPAIAVLAGAAWAAVLAATGTFEQLLTYVVFAAWIFYALGAATVFLYRKRLGAAALPYRTPGYPITPILFILSSVALVGNTLVSKPLEAAVGLGFLAAGVPVYFVWRNLARRSESGE
jgi:basic amino acid/polyamine antiporter, APA family